MDKIQEAIAKAREKRGTTTAAAPRAGKGVLPGRPEGADGGATRAPRPGSEAAVAAAWAAVPDVAPSLGRLRRNRILTADGGRAATDFDVLRTRLLQQTRPNGWKRVAITSPGPACGKSTLALNLAFSLARQREQRTVLIEMDLRRPSIAKTLGLREKHEMSRVLSGEADFDQNVLRMGDNLMIATQTGSVRNAAELLQSARTGEILDQIEATYAPSIILFDLPPMLAGDDAMAFMNHVDCAVLVAAAEQSTIKQIDACERDIASQTNMLGVVLNKCRYMDRDSTYDYYD